MKLLFIVLAALTIPAFAQTMPELKLSIARDIDSILGDTVNEGEMHAGVKFINKVPQMDCNLIDSKKDPETKLARCDVRFVVEHDEGPSCETSCFLIYKVKNKDITPVRDLEDSCLENLATTDCQ
jgi:hypothetical protein